MKTYRLTYVGIVLAFLIALGSFMQWQIWNNDLSQFIFGFVFAAIVLAFAYVHNVMKHRDESDEELRCDIKAIDQRLTKLECKVIEWNKN